MCDMMTPPKMSKEWEALAARYNDIARVPSSIAEYKELKRQQGVYGQDVLNTPAFALLKNAVAVENATAQLSEVPGHEFPIRIYRPAQENATALPVMLYFHGGWWVGGDSNAEDLGCRAIIARGNKIIIISFEYRLVCDVNWQVMFSDAENAVKWLWRNANRYGGDVTKGFLIGGAEAGCHLAAIAAIRTRDRQPDITITGQCLIVPTTVAWPDPEIPEMWAKQLNSHIENATAPVLNESLYETFVDALGMPLAEKRKGENFPMWASLKELPSAYLAMDECDPTRDQGFLYAELLREAGVQTRVDYYEGLPNMFVNFPDLPTTLVAGGQLAAGIAWLLEC